jgi:hypothetical protein
MSFTGPAGHISSSNNASLWGDGAAPTFAGSDTDGGNSGGGNSGDTTGDGSRNFAGGDGPDVATEAGWTHLEPRLSSLALRHDSGVHNYSCLFNMYFYLIFYDFLLYFYELLLTPRSARLQHCDNIL